MKSTIKKVVGSGGEKFDVTLTFDGVNEDTIQDWAVNYLVWKVQRTLREAKDAQLKKWKDEGLSLHASEVGKPIVSAEEQVAKMTPEQSLEAYELLKAKLGL